MSPELRTYLEANRAKTRVPRENFEDAFRRRIGTEVFDALPRVRMPYDDRTLGQYLLDTLDAQLRDAYYAGRANAFAEMRELTAYDFAPTFRNSP